MADYCKHGTSGWCGLCRHEHMLRERACNHPDVVALRAQLEQAQAEIHQIRKRYEKQMVFDAMAGDTPLVKRVAFAIAQADMTKAGTSVPRWAHFSEHAKIMYTEIARVALSVVPDRSKELDRVKELESIETAPKDGSRLLFYFKRRDVFVSGRWHTERGHSGPYGDEPGWSWWVTDNDLVVLDGGPDDIPDSWMPLPLVDSARGGEHG